MKNIFADNNVVEYHLKEEFEKIPQTKLIDQVQEIANNSPGQMKILDTWMVHFRQQRVPFKVSSRPRFDVKGRHLYNILTLWKEDLIEFDTNTKKSKGGL